MLYAPPALAHHAIGGRLPTNAWEGFLAGLAHPIIGPDHFLFVLAIALLALRLGAGLWLPVVFVLGGLAGSGFHLGSGDLPLLEVGIASSIVGVGLCLARVEPPKSVGMLILGAIAGLFHGYAFAEAIIGAQMAPLGAYLLGLTVIQLGVAATVYGGAKAAMAHFAQDPSTVLRYAGFAFMGAGVAFLSGVLAG